MIYKTGRPYTQQTIFAAIEAGKVVTLNGKPITIFDDCEAGVCLDLGGMLAPMTNPDDSVLCIDAIEGIPCMFKPSSFYSQPQRDAFKRQVANGEEITISRINDALYTIDLIYGRIDTKLPERFFDLVTDAMNVEYDWTQDDLVFIASLIP